MTQQYSEYLRRTACNHRGRETYRLERITSYFYLLPQNTFVWPSSFCLHIPLSHARLLALLSSAMVPLFSMVISTYLPTYLPAPNPLRQEEGRGGAWRHLCRFSNHSTGLLASSWEVFLALISKVKCNAMGHNKSSKEKSPHSVSKPLQDSCRASKCEHTPWAHSTGQSASHDFSMWSWGLNRGCFNLTLCFQPQASRQFLRQLQGVAGMWAITHKALAAAKSPSQGGLSAAASRLGSTAGVPVPLSQGKDWMAFSFKWQVSCGHRRNKTKRKSLTNSFVACERTDSTEHCLPHAVGQNHRKRSSTAFLLLGPRLDPAYPGETTSNM